MARAPRSRERRLRRRRRSTTEREMRAFSQARDALARAAARNRPATS